MCKIACLKVFLFGVCACVNFAIPLTLVISMNALFSDWLTYFQADRGTTSAVQATCIGVTLGAGLVAGFLERKLGERRSLTLGSFLSAVGLVAGSYAPSLPALILFVGVVTGGGFCLVHLSTLSTALRRFPKRAGLMSSAMTSVAGTFHLATPLLYRYLSEEYTWRGSLLVASGIAMHSAIFGLLLTSPVLQPTPALPTILCSTGDGHLDAANSVTRHAQHTMLELEKTKPEHSGQVELKANLSTDTNDCSVTTTDFSGNDVNFSNDVQVRDCGHDESEPLSAEELRTEPVVTPEQPLLEERQSQCAPDSNDATTAFVRTDQPLKSHNHVPRTTHVCDREQLEDLTQQQDPGKGALLTRVPTLGFNMRLYLCVLLFTVVCLSTNFSFVLLVLDFAAHRGWTVQDGVLLNFVFMLSGLVARLLVGVVSLHEHVHSTALLIGGGVIGSAGLCLVGQVHTFSLVAVFYAAMGVGYGVVVGLFPPAVLDITGPRVYPLTLGLVCTAEGVLNTTFGILTGSLVDVLQSYSLLSLVYGLLSLGCTVLLLVVYLSHR